MNNRLCRWYDDQREQADIECPFVGIDSFARCKTCPKPDMKVEYATKVGGAGTEYYTGYSGKQKTVVSRFFLSSQKEKRKVK